MKKEVKEVKDKDAFVIFNLSMYETQHEKIRKKAFDEKVSMSKLIRDAIDKYLSKHA